MALPPLSTEFPAHLSVATAPFKIQFNLLFKRAFKNAIRNKLLMQGRFATMLILSLLGGLVYLDVTDDQRGVQDRESSLFFFLINSFIGSSMGVIAIFALEKAVFTREYQNGLYKLPAYFLSRTVVEIPFRIILPILGAIVAYWMVGYQSSATKFLYFAALSIASENIGSALGIFVASLFPELPVALAVLPLLLMPYVLFSGFFLNADSTPIYFEWARYASPMMYAFVALVKNEFEGLSIYCTSSQYISDGTDEVCPITNGAQVITQLGFDGLGSVAENLGILAGFYVAFMACAYIALWRQVQGGREEPCCKRS